MSDGTGLSTARLSADEYVQRIGRLSARLRALRADRDLSLRDVAAATGISRSALNHLENSPDANPQLTTLVALADFFDLHSLEELFGPLPSRQLWAEADGA